MNLAIVLRGEDFEECHQVLNIFTLPSCLHVSQLSGEYVLKALLLSTVLGEKDCLEQGLTTGEGGLKNCICNKAVCQWSVLYDFAPGCLKCLEWIWMQNPYFYNFFLFVYMLIVSNEVRYAPRKHLYTFIHLEDS